MTALALRSADDCTRLIEATYGDPALAAVSVLHTTAVWMDPSGRSLTLRIGPDTPRSPRDRFVLGLARARCDAVLTTGRILRAEPALRHRYLDEAVGDAALAAWRRAAIGRADRPETVILTGGAAVDFRHPIFRDGAPVTLFTGEAAAAALRPSAPPGVRVLGDPAPSARRALEALGGEGKSVCVEAGASSSAALYDAPPRVGELMLSTFLGEALPGALRGPRFEMDRVAAIGMQRVGSGEVREASGPWRFERYRIV